MTSPDFFYYFAFGSNLLKERIRVQNKGAEYECNGVLRDFELQFVSYGKRWKGALATITASPGNKVWGCVWRVPNAFAEELDRQEAGYYRLQVDVSAGDRIISCRTYQFADPAALPTKPSPHYKAVIVSGAEEHGLPEDYVYHLRNMSDNGYQGTVDVDLHVLRHLNGKQ